MEYKDYKVPMPQQAKKDKEVGKAYESADLPRKSLMSIFL